MRAVTCEKGVLEVAEVADPTPERGHVVLEVRACGICGSDLHAREHCDDVAEDAAASGYDAFMRSDQTVVMGHEFCGEVVDHGPRTPRRLKPGTLAVSPADGARRRPGASDRSVRACARWLRRAGADPGGAHPAGAQRAARAGGGADRADGGRAARRTPWRRGEEAGGLRDRLRPDRARRDRDAQGHRGAHRRGQRLLARPPGAGHRDGRRRRGRPGHGVAVRRRSRTGS